MNSKALHISALSHESVQAFEGVNIGVFFEGTLGMGGHAELFLEAHPEIETYIGCDQDLSALKIAQKNLEPWKQKIDFVHGNFRHLDEFLKERDIERVDGFFLTSSSLQCNSMNRKEDLVF